MWKRPLAVNTTVRRSAGEDWLKAHGVQYAREVIEMISDVPYLHFVFRLNGYEFHMTDRFAYYQVSMFATDETEAVSCTHCGEPVSEHKWFGRSLAETGLWHRFMGYDIKPSEDKSEWEK
jgi:hypothetical protein